MMITFSGLDGSGKSTLIQAIRSRLERAGRQTVVLTMYDHVGTYPAIRFMRDSVVKRLVARLRGRRVGPPRSTDPDRLGVAQERRGPVMRTVLAIVRSASLKRVVLALDVVLFYLYRLYFEGLCGRVLVMDRYFFDLMADVAPSTSDRVLRSYLALAPNPDVAVFVDVDPEKAFARKGEYSVDYNTRRRRQYRRIFAMVPRATVLVNDDMAKSLEVMDGIAARVAGKSAAPPAAAS